jgi:P pilus assembly chaperone PapD
VKRFLSVSFLLPSFFAGLAISRPDRCFASAFKVTPVKVLLTRRVPTALLTLKNESNRTLRFQARAFAWDQDGDGRMQLASTQDIVFFPMLLSVRPGEERKVRLGTGVAFGSLEKSYRIFFEELPEFEKAGSSQGSQLQIRTRIGVPIFLRPEKPAASSQLDAVALRAGVLRFSVRNTGNVHVNLLGVRVKGLGASGDTRFERESDGWYVLAGGSRNFEIEIPKRSCRGIARFSIEAQVDGKTLVEDLESSPGFCP